MRSGLSLSPHALLLSSSTNCLTMSSCLGRTVLKSWRSIQVCRQLPRLPRPLPKKLPSRVCLSRPQSYSELSFHPLPFAQQRFSSTTLSHVNSSLRTEDILPICCPGCGAYSQTIEPEEPGYYGKTRKQTRKFLSEARKDSQSAPEGSKDTKLEDDGMAASNAFPINEEVVPKSGRAYNSSHSAVAAIETDACLSR